MARGPSRRAPGSPSARARPGFAFSISKTAAVVVRRGRNVIDAKVCVKAIIAGCQQAGRPLEPATNKKALLGSLND